jgi:colanic acid biosynthesis glycosyl transferase WcaI
MPCKVLLLTQWFDPEPTIKGLSFARELMRRGFEVEVLTGFPNYPTGSLYPGYRLRPWQRESLDGVLVHRVALYPSHDSSGIRRTLNYASFAASALVYGLGIVRRFDVIYAYHPPLSVGAIAAMLGRMCRRPVVYDVQDLWPDTLEATGMVQSRRVLGIVGRVCRWVYRNVDRIAVLSPGFRAALLDRGVPPGKVDVIYNWADAETLATPAGAMPPGFPPADRFRIVFAGNMGRAQGLGAVLEAARLLQDDGSNVAFVLMGAGVEVAALRKRAIALGLGNVSFLPPVPMSEVGSVLSSADALLVHLRKDPLFAVTIPSKTQAYLAMGKPILVAVDGDAARLVTSAAAGIVAEPENPFSIAQAAASLAAMGEQDLRQMGERASRYYREHLSLEQGAGKFAALFDTVASRARQ